MRPRPVVGKAAVPEAVRRLMDRFDYPDRATPAQTIPIRPALGAGGGIGAFVHLTRAATQSIASAGEAIEWDTLGLQGFSGFTTTVSTTTVSIPQPGYYNLDVMFGWSSFTGGGTVTVKKNSVTVWPPTDDPGLWSSEDGQLFEGTAHAIECAVGDTLSVEINPDDASAQTLASATFTAYLVDRAANQGAYKELVLSHGPRAYWRFDETAGATADDIAGHTDGPFDATYIDTPTLDQIGVMQDGSSNASVEFNGSSEYATVPLAAVSGLGELTVEAWIYRDVASVAHAIFAVNDSDLAQFNRWVIWISAANVAQYSEDGGITLNGTVAIAANTPYHIVITRTAPDTVSIYVNGVLDIATTGTAWAVAGAGDTVQIGMDLDAGSTASDWFNGRVDEPALYGRALSAIEVLEHYTVGSN